MSTFYVNLQSLETLRGALLDVAVELENCNESINGGYGYSPAGVQDSINGAWSTMYPWLSNYVGSINGAGRNLENIVTVLDHAIKHYADTEANIAATAKGQAR